MISDSEAIESAFYEYEYEEACIVLKEERNIDQHEVDL